MDKLYKYTISEKSADTIDDYFYEVLTGQIAKTHEYVKKQYPDMDNKKTVKYVKENTEIGEYFSRFQDIIKEIQPQQIKKLEREINELEKPVMVKTSNKFSLTEKKRYYQNRLTDKSLTHGQRKFAEKRLRDLKSR